MHFGALRSRFHPQSALCSYVTGPIGPFTDAARIATLSLSSFRRRAVRPNVPGLKRVWGVLFCALRDGFDSYDLASRRKRAINLSHDLLCPLNACSDELVRPWASLRPAEQVISGLHVQTRQYRCHDSDHTFAALVHPSMIHVRFIFANCQITLTVLVTGSRLTECFHEEELMDRRQLLFGATALGLVTNLNLNHLLLAQVGYAVGKGRLSDRERAGLRGSVKTCSVFSGDEAESMHDAEYGTDGRLLVSRYISRGSRVEQVYSYDGMGRLIGVTGGGANGTDEFQYDGQGKKTRVRTVPPRPDQNSAWGVGIMFEATEEGHCLKYGGSVTTRYNDDDQPIESLVQDVHGELLVRIIHNYANGRLIGETLVREAFGLPDEFQEQLSEEQRRTLRAKMKEAFSKLGVFGSMERSYVYDDKGRVIKRQMRMGNFRQDTTITYNEHGDEAETVMIQSGSLGPEPPHDERFEVRYLYQYDSHGNWVEKTTDRSSSGTHRQLTYY